MNDVQLIQTPCVFGENGNFLLERELGKGGMGGVYMGRDKMLDRPVAVKVMLKEYGADAQFVERFKKEAQAAARLIHPNIAQIYSYGIADEMPYIAMELVAGGSLDSIMRNSGGSSDVARIMKIGEQVAQALRCAADQGLVHGDVKPENILLDANGNAKLVDFGLAAMQHNTDEIWGTPYYIAPNLRASLSLLFFSLKSQSPPPTRAIAPRMPPITIATLPPMEPSSSSSAEPPLERLLLLLRKLDFSSAGSASAESSLAEAWGRTVSVRFGLIIRRFLPDAGFAALAAGAAEGIGFRTCEAEIPMERTAFQSASRASNVG